MIRLAECELRKLYLWHANLFSSIYMYICLHIVIFIYTRYCLNLGVFDPWQIICYDWLDSYNYNLMLFVCLCGKWFLLLKGSQLVP